MTRFSLYVFLLLTVALLFVPRTSFAAESYDNCAGFITSVPTVINASGTWCLNQDVSTSVANAKAIDIQANNVTIDCNDFKIDGLGAGLGTTAYGIYANNRLNATVRNCHIRGFYFGIYILGASGGGHVIEDNRFTGNTYIGLRVDGDGSVIRRNRVSDTGGSTANANAFGINTNYSVDVLDNTVSTVAARVGGGGSAYGIYTVSNLNASVNGNRVRSVLKDGAGLAYGIWNASSARVTLRANDVIGTGNVGIRCGTSSGSATDNVINGFVTGLLGCANDGGNVIKP